jgi:hypothetical protein
MRTTTSRLATTVPLGKEVILLSLAVTNLRNGSNKVIIPKFDMFLIVRVGYSPKNHARARVDHVRFKAEHSIRLTDTARINVMR